MKQGRDPANAGYRGETMINRLLVAAMAVVLFADTTQADILWGVRAGQLVVIDTDTVSGSVIGTVGFDLVGGLAFGNDGTLYGIAAQNDALIEIDTVTGAGSLVGATGRPISFSTSLANDPTTDTLYGITEEAPRKAVSW